MRQSAKRAIARSVNELADGLDQGDDVDLWENAASVRSRLSLLLDRVDEETDRVQHHNAGARVKVTMDRGESPRDQDSWTIEGQGETHEDAAREFDALLEEYKGRWADDVCDTDPYE